MSAWRDGRGPHPVTRATLFYERSPIAATSSTRRDNIDARVRQVFDASGGTHGNPRALGQLRDAGERARKKTVEDSTARQGLIDRGAAPSPDLVRPDINVDLAVIGLEVQHRDVPALRERARRPGNGLLSAT